MNLIYENTQETQALYRERRSRDVKDEKIVGEFLDAYFYPTFSTTISRNTDRATQIRGLDVTVTNEEGFKYTIDEKAATRWAGRYLPTFAHEINSVNIYGKVYNGWLMDAHSASDYLVEVWIDATNTIDGKLIDYTSITDATIVLIKKKDLYNYFHSKDITSTALMEVGNELRMRGDYCTYYKGFKITCQQPPIQERAANILIPRDTLINTISCYAAQIKDGKVIPLRK